MKELIVGSNLCKTHYVLRLILGFSLKINTLWLNIKIPILHTFFVHRYLIFFNVLEQDKIFFTIVLLESQNP